MHKKYVIPGNITKMANIFEDQKRMWDGNAELKARMVIELERQHGLAALFSGPLHIDATFFLPYSKEVSVRNRPNFILHTTRPYMSSLIYFVEHIASGILFDSGATIAAVSCSKFLTAENPRAEIEITSLKTNPIQTVG